MMNANKTTRIVSKIYIGFSIFSLGYVSILSMYSPQATMDLVQTTLPNNDAISSIRGIYGGVGLVITITLVYLLLRDIKKGLLFLALFWSAYAISRLVTISVDGALGDFGTQWIVIESTLGILAVLLFLLQNKQSTIEE